MPAQSAPMGQGPGRVSRLELQDFKTYRGHHTLGPFTNFTAIIGPNGSGKSNLMNAFCFVLCESKSDMRADKLGDLIYNGGAGGGPNPRKAFVKLVYEHPGGAEVTFQRTVDTQGKCDYHVDDSRVTMEDYKRRLGDLGMQNTKRFLVYQNTVVKVAEMKPAMLTEVMEAVSGSDAYKEAYEEKDEAKSKAEEASQQAFKQHKRADQAKKAKAKEKAEAEAFLKSQEDLEEMKRQRFLAEAYHAERDARAVGEQLAEAKAALADVQQRHAQNDSREAESRKRAAQAQKEVNAADKALTKKKEEATALVAREKLLRHEEEKGKKGLKAAQDDLKRRGKELERAAAEAEEREADIAETEAKAEEFERKVVAEMQQASAVPVTPAELREFEGKEREVAKRTSAEQRALKEKLDRVANEERVTQADENERATIRGRLAELEERLAKSAEDGKLLKQAVEEAQARRQEARRRAQPLGERHRLAAMERDAAQKDHAAAEAQMQELRGKAHEHKRERRSEEAVQRLLQQFPGRVLGRLGELFSVPSQRDTTAVLISLGRWVDAIVTTDDAAAKECIALLKEHRLGRFQFIPLDSVQVREVDERLRHLGGTARLAVDCTSTADERVRRALLFALGKGLIADTEAEARRVAYDGPQRLTCVSLDGIKVDRRGAITGGQGGDGGRGRNARQQPFDRAAVEQVQRRELELRERLERAGVAVAAAKAAEEQAQEEDRALAQSLQGFQDRARAHEAEVVRDRGSKDSLAKQLAGVDARAEARAAEAAALQPDIARLRAAIAEVEAAVFGGFCQRMGVATPEEWRRLHLTRLPEIDRERKRLKTAVDNLREQAEDARESFKRKTQEEKKAKDKVAACEAKLAKTVEDIDKCKAEAQGFKGEIQALEKRLAEAKEAAKAADAEVAEMKAAAKGRTDEVKKAQQGVNRLEGKLADLRELLETVLESARLANVDLPRVSGGAAAAAAAAEKEKDKGRGKKRKAQAAPEEGEEADGGAEAMDVDGEEQALDYSSLTREHKAATVPSDREALLKRLDAAIAERTAALERQQPNLKAVEQFAALAEDEAKAKEALQAAQAAARAAGVEFTAVRKRRLDLFNECYEFVSNRLDPVYKQLTWGNNAMGGTASLRLENPDEPFLSGIRLDATPAAKRARETHSLSGGEKSIAALALLFAIQGFRPSPVFIMDEVDAALDPDNVKIVADYLRKKAHAGPRPALQSIVISHKQLLYSRADALVGVCLDGDHAYASKTVTLDMTRFSEH